MIKYNYKEYTIEIYGTTAYENNYEGAEAKFDKFYFGVEAEEYPASQCGIKVYFNNEVVKSATVVASGGATGVFENTTLIDGDLLLICCGNTIFCLTLPELELKWSTKADEATCFEIFKYEEDYLIHGELEITRLDRNGNKKWHFAGKDIFVSPDEEAFKIENNTILVKDWENTLYVIDANNGTTIN